MFVEYHSRSVAGADITVSGVIAYPSDSVPVPDGGRPVLTWAHGTTGLADACAPSADAGTFAALSTWVNSFLDKGMVVVATDYEGLGEPGRHPYLVGESEGRGVLDIVRAARNIPEAHAGADVVIWGHSQGGQAALFANEIAATWAPELHVLGTVAGAPAADLDSLVSTLDSERYGYFGVMVAAGFQAAYPDLDLHDVLTDEAIARMGVVDTGCSSDVAKAYADLTPAQVQKADPRTVPAWQARLVANSPGQVRTDDPILIYQGSSDELIPVAESRRLFERLCSEGQVAERKVYDGLSHVGVVLAAFPDIATWIDARIAGTPATNGCPPS